MDAINAARDWFFNTAVRYKLGDNDSGKEVYVSLYALPERKGQAIVYTMDKPEQAWQQVEFAITQAQAAHRTFALYVATQKNDPAAMRWPITLSGYAPQMQGQGGNIAGFYSPQMPPLPNQPSIGEIEKRLERQFEDKLAAALEKKELTDTIGALAQTVKELKKGGATGYSISDFIEQTGLNLSDPAAIQAAVGGIQGLLATGIGMLGTLLGKGGQQAPVVAGAPHYRPRPTTRIKEQPHDEPVPPMASTEFDNHENEEMDEEIDLSENDVKAIEAVRILEAAGFDDAGDVLMQIANWASKNPEQSRNYLQFLK